MNSEKAFWSMVADCLRTFHGRSVAQANELVVDRQRAVRRSGDPELVYHDDPFQIACGLAREHLDVIEHLDAYRAVRARYFKPERQPAAV